MKAFSYERVQSPVEAVAAHRHRPAARYIAGGTNLIDLMKLEIETPTHLIDINDAGLDGIEDMPDGSIRIGALVSNTDLASDQRIRTHYPIVARSILAGASGQLRNMATVGGNLMQRTRCPYFYDLNLPCNKRNPGTGCSAMGGYSRTHAIVGIGSCICAFLGDMSVALRLLDAVVEVMRPDGAIRTVPIGNFHKAPGHGEVIDEFALETGELIVAVLLPAPLSGSFAYHKVRDRASFAFALVSVAVVLFADRSGRVALGGVGTKPWRSEEGDAALTLGAKAASEALLTNALPTEHNRYKVELTERAMAAALEDAQRVEQ